MTRAIDAEAGGDRLLGHLDAYGSFVTELRRDSDRAAVIVAASWCEEHLADLLRAVLRPSPHTNRDELLDSEKALGTFSARTNVVHRLGMIDDASWRSLNLLRKLRNACAHSHGVIDLAQPPHRDRVRELVASVVSVPRVWPLAWTIATGKPPPHPDLKPDDGTGSENFRVVASWMAAVLRVAVVGARPLPWESPTSFTDAWRLVAEFGEGLARARVEYIDGEHGMIARIDIRPGVRVTIATGAAVGKALPDDS